MELRTKRIRRLKTTPEIRRELEGPVYSDGTATPGTRPYCWACGVPRGYAPPEKPSSNSRYWREMAGAQEERADGYLAEILLLHDEIKRLEKMLAWALQGRNKAA